MICRTNNELYKALDKGLNAELYGNFELIRSLQMLPIITLWEGSLAIVLQPRSNPTIQVYGQSRCSVEVTSSPCVLHLEAHDQSDLRVKSLVESKPHIYMYGEANVTLEQSGLVIPNFSIHGKNTPLIIAHPPYPPSSVVIPKILKKSALDLLLED